nr:uracil-DNA glycosylase [Vibrio maerlii]
MNNWQALIEQEKAEPYFVEMESKIESRRKAGVKVFPQPEDIYSAFEATPLDQVKVVIIGQDPYHGAGQAHGLSFSVHPGVKIPPSLRNMYKELAEDIEGFELPKHGYLQSWAEQGVLLLNTVLTVEEGSAHSHAKFGWETFTDVVIKTLSQQKQPIVFLLWGAHAQKKGKDIDENHHCVLKTVHPSPLSARRGFFGCKHFSQANQFLIEQGHSAINWQV